MIREEIVEALTHRKNGENNRKLLDFCREPCTFGRMGRAGVRGDVFKILVELKKSGAIAWKEGKYYSTPEALEILDSL